MLNSRKWARPIKLAWKRVLLNGLFEFSSVHAEGVLIYWKQVWTNLMRGLWMVLELKCVFGVWWSWLNFRSDIYFFYCCWNLEKTPVLYRRLPICTLTAWCTTFLIFNQNISSKKNPSNCFFRAGDSFLPGWSRFFLQDRPPSPSPAVRKQHTGGKAWLWSGAAAPFTYWHVFAVVLQLLTTSCLFSSLGSRSFTDAA